MSLQTDTVRARLRPFGISFEKSLADLIKGIRANKQKDLEIYLNRCIQECKDELKSTDLAVKSTAILKLIYLELYGYDMSWCSFQILEVMSSSVFQFKRIGYLAAIQLLLRYNNDDVLMLMTNLLKKDLNSSNYMEAGLAISGISAIVTRELSQDILDDMCRMLSHSKGYIRKKSILCMHKIFLKYPEALRTNFSRIVDKLADQDQSVVSATVNVICELAEKNPSDYVEVSPKLFEILVTSKNNWLIIRLLKLFSSLSLIEPRLTRKLKPALLQIISETSASSLIYECINCALNGSILLPDDTKMAQLMTDEIEKFFATGDQNLKYVGLLSLVKIIHIHPYLAEKKADTILSCFEDPDLTIRSKALDVVDFLVSEKNIRNIVGKLLLQLVPMEVTDDEFDTKTHLETYNYRRALREQSASVPNHFKVLVLTKIVSIASHNNYANVPDFEWFLSVLGDLLRILVVEESNAVVRLQTEKVVSFQISSLCLRVPSLRPSIVDFCIEWVSEGTQLAQTCIWCIGEYYTAEEEFVSIERLLDVITKSSASCTIIQSALKLYARQVELTSSWETDLARVRNINSQLVLWLDTLTSDPSFEIQERSCEYLELVKLFEEGFQEHSEGEPMFLTKLLPSLFDGFELKPINKNIQKSIPLPSDFSLDDPPQFLDNLLERSQEHHYVSSEDESEEEKQEERLQEERLQEERLQEEEQPKLDHSNKRDDPFYLLDTPIESAVASEPKAKTKNPKRAKGKVVVLNDDDEDMVLGQDSNPVVKPRRRKNMLMIDSSNLDNFSIQQEDESVPQSEIENIRKDFVVKPKKKKDGKRKVKKKKAIIEEA